MASRWSLLLTRLSQLLLLTALVHGEVILDETQDKQTVQHNATQDLNPCALNSVSDKPSGYCHCNVDYTEVEEVKCGFQKNPLDIEWRAIALFSRVQSITLWNRPQGVIRSIPPRHVFLGQRQLRYFVMKMADLNTIPSFAFANSSSLFEIDLTDDSIRALAPYAFANLNNVSEINLHENLLTEINRNVFSNLPNLKTLVLSKNQIQTIHDNAFKDLTNLVDLAIQNNNLSVIAREVLTGLVRTTKLDLRGNMINYIGDHAFAEMPLLEDLDLSENNIISISPTAFAGLKDLKRLNLRKNKIVEIHTGTFDHLSKIHFLDLRANQLETLNFTLMEPIYKNLINMNMQLLVDENRFKCGCSILWMKQLFKETASVYVRNHIADISCDLFGEPGKRLTTSTQFHKERDPSNITILTSPPEETTTYDFESVRKVVNLTVEELNCQKKDKVMDHGTEHHDATFMYNQVTNTGNKMEPKPKEHDLAKNWDSNGDSHQRDSQIGNSFGHDDKEHQDARLNEPQATAALEGTDVSGKAPKGASPGRKLETSKMNSAQSQAAKFRYCDPILVSFLLYFGTYII